jgi:hypothetical protein
LKRVHSLTSDQKADRVTCVAALVTDITAHIQPTFVQDSESTSSKNSIHSQYRSSHHTLRRPRNSSLYLLYLERKKHFCNRGGDQYAHQRTLLEPECFWITEGVFITSPSLLRMRNSWQRKCPEKLAEAVDRGARNQGKRSKCYELRNSKEYYLVVMQVPVVTDSLT